jgi:WD40 repeat protein
VLERVGLVSAPPGDSTYHAFISYSHAVDGTLAPALEHGLQRFAKPWYRARAVRVFRDEASLSANPGLWTSIEEALDSSLFFILLASPGAAASPWVAREAAHWRAHKPLRNLLIALTDGDLVWNADGDFDWERTTSLPETLRGAFGEEPRFVDLRWARTTAQLSLDNPLFREAIADLGAPLHGLPKDVLAGEEIRQQRRTVRIARAVAVTFACLTVVALVFATFALVQRNEARRQRDLATSRALVQAASANLESRIDRAALLTLEAYRIRPSTEARRSLVRAIQRSEHIAGLLHVEQPLERIVLDADRDLVAAAGVRNVTIGSLGPPARVKGTLPVRGAKALALAPNQAVLAVGGPTAISLWRLEGRPESTRRINFLGARALSFSKDGRRLSAVGPAEVAIFDLRTGKRMVRRPLGMSVSTAEVAPGGTLAAIGGLETLLLLDTTRRRPTRRIQTADTPLAVAFDREQKRVAAVGLRGDAATVWSVATGRVVARLPLRQTAQTVAFARDGRLVLGMTDGSVALRRIGNADPPQVLRGPTGSVLDVDLAPGGVLATAGDQGIIVLWEPSGSTFRRELAELEDPIEAVDFSEEGEALAVGGFGDVVNVWSFENGTPARRHVSSGPVSAVAVGREGRVVTASGGQVAMHDADGDRRVLEHPGGGRVGALELDARDLLAWSIQDRVELWDAAAPRRLEPLSASGNLVDLDLSGDGEYLVVADERGATLWNLADRSATRLLGRRDVSAVAIGQSGRVVVSAIDGQVLMADVGRPGLPIALPIAQGASVELALSPDETTLAIGTSESALLLVDAETGLLLGAPLSVPGGPVTGLDFSADGAVLATGTQGGVVTLWDDALWSDVSAMRRRLCEVAGRNLTADEWRELVPGQPYRSTCP